jgi:probable HAF family extracellular repeat protein
MLATNSRRWRCAMACAALTIASGLATATQLFTGLGALPGGTGSTAMGISANGLTVVGSAGAADHHIHAFRWTAATGMQDLGLFPGGGFTEATAVSADGSVVAGYGQTAAGNFHAFRWTSTAGLQDLGLLPGATLSQAHGISADGKFIVGISANNDTSVAFRWNQTTGMTAISQLDEANGASADASSIVGVSAGVAAIFTGAGIDRLGILPGGTGDSALAISPDGTVVVGVADSTDGIRAFRWSAPVGISSRGGLPGADSSVAFCTSASGSTIGGQAFFNPDPVHAFIWHSGSIIDVNDLLARNSTDLTGWSLDAVRGLSADGSVMIGTARHGNTSEAWIAGVPPICASADFNCDGDVGTDADIESFFACLSGVCPPNSCGSTADINNDGDVGTDQDIEAFFRILGGGNC